MQPAEIGTPAPTHGNRLVQLDGLRGIGALVIMLYHLDMVFGIHGHFIRGYLLVDLFFLLSGFVLAVSTEKKLMAGIGPLVFTWNRLKRLWPLVVVGTGVAAVRALVQHQADPLTLLWWLALDLAMIPSLAGNGPFYRFNGPQWTLFYELIANFLHALVLKLVPTKALGWLALILGAALVKTVLLHGSDTMGVNAPSWATWWQALPRVGFSYVLGVWIGRHYLAGLRSPALPWWLALPLPVVGVALIPMLPLSVAHGDLAFVILFLPIVMWNVALANPPSSLRPALQWLGSYSLPLYCVHLTVLVWVSELLGRAAWVPPIAIAMALAISGVFSRLVSFAAKPTPTRAV